MKYILITLIITVISLDVNAQEKTFQGTIKGIENAEINVEVLPLKIGASPIFDKIQCINGEFECKVDFKIDMWHLIRLNSKDFDKFFGTESYEKKNDTVIGVEKSILQELKNREIVFFIQPKDKINIYAKMGKLGINYQVTGNEICNQRNEFSTKLFSLEEEYNRLTILQEGCRIQNQKGKVNDIKSQILLVNNQISTIELKTILDHPDWNYSAARIAAFPEDTIAKYFRNFTNDVQNSFFGMYLSKILTASQIGSLAPEFTLKNETEKRVSLSDFHGRFIVLDFWGTWCGYCLKGIPKMKDYYSKYKDKVEFINIGCRDDKQVWLKTLVKYKIEGVNLFAEDDDIPDKYGVIGHPTKIIIDPEGKIVLKTIGESDDFYDKIDELFNK